MGFDQKTEGEVILLYYFTTFMKTINVWITLVLSLVRPSREGVKYGRETAAVGNGNNT